MIYCTMQGRTRSSDRIVVCPLQWIATPQGEMARRPNQTLSQCQSSAEWTQISCSAATDMPTRQSGNYHEWSGP
jgi:hypothetical protein